MYLLHNTLCPRAVKDRPAEAVVRQVERLLELGYREVVLTDPRYPMEWIPARIPTSLG